MQGDLKYRIIKKSPGFKILLNFHYSDTWAYPGKQFTPAEAFSTNREMHLRELAPGMNNKSNFNVVLIRKN